MKRIGLQSFILIVGLAFSPFCNAGSPPFSITVMQGTTLPTTVPPGGEVDAFYTIVNNSASTRTANFVKWLPPNVTQVTNDSAYCPASFNLSPSAGCNLKLKITGATAPDPNQPPSHQKLLICYQGGSVCSGPNPQDQLNVVVSGSNKKPFAYVANFGGGPGTTISICPINANGLIDTCTDTTAPNIFSGPYGITVNTAGTMAYITNTGTSSVFTCPINKDGSFGTCIATAGFGFSFSIALTPTTAYIAENGGNAHSCTLNADNTLGTCTSYPSIPTTYYIIINKQKTIAYIPSSNTAVTICPILTNGLLGTCTDSLGNGTFNQPTAMAINKDNTRAYITNIGDGTISVCPILNDGSFGTCTTEAGPFGSDGSIVLNAANTVAYTVNGSTGDIYSCPINSADGSFGTCQITNLPQGPIFLALNDKNTMLYSTDIFGPVSNCSINPDGTLGACINSSSSSFYRTSLALANV